VDLSDLSSPAVASLSRDMPVVIPIAALEQHGRHLPLFTDSLLLGEVIRRVKEPLKDRVLFAPLMWLGNSDHHLDFPGTLSARPRTYLDLLGGLAEDFIRHGFRRIVFLNGHGGNDVPGRQAVFEVRQRHRQRKDLLLLMGTYWALGARPWESDASLHQREMGHACEWETSMILRLSPGWVGEYRGLPPVEPGNAFAPGTRGWITPDRSVPGHIGWPHLATAEKGETLFRVFSSDAVAWLERVICWDGHSWEG
jgi:creatinine amidohydrolase